jgi:hypothetical protein
MSGSWPALDAGAIDVEAHLWALLKSLGGITVFTYDVQTSAYHWRQVHSVQVDTRAGSKKAAFDGAWAAGKLVLSLPPARWQDGVVSDAAVVSGPSWLPDENGAPRYTARYGLTVHPPNGSTP